MKALSIDPLPVMQMEWSRKFIEYRTWKTSYRGPLLICATAKKVPGCISGYAWFYAELMDVVPFEEYDLQGACMDRMPDQPGYAWILDIPNKISIYPIKVKGKQGLFDVNDDLIHSVDDDWTPDGDLGPADPDEWAQWFNAKYLDPLIYEPAQL